MQDSNGPNSSNTAYICNRITNPNKKEKKTSRIGSDQEEEVTYYDGFNALLS